MNKRYISNIIYCIFIPTFIAGLVGVGTFFLSFGAYPITVTVFLSGAIAYLVGSMIRGIYKWEEAKKNENK